MLVGLTLNGRTYIYRGVDWTTSTESALVSVLVCLVVLLLYFGNYYLVHKFTQQKRALLAALEFEMVQQVSCEPHKVRYFRTYLALTQIPRAAFCSVHSGDSGLCREARVKVRRSRRG